MRRIATPLATGGNNGLNRSHSTEAYSVVEQIYTFLYSRREAR